MDVSISASIYWVTVLLVVGAAVSDLKTRRIPNALFVAGALLGVTLNSLDNQWQGLGTSLAGFAAGAAIVLPGYLLRFTGGGDLKLVAAVGSLLGAKMVLLAFALAALFAGLWALAHGIWEWARKGTSLPFARYGAMLSFMVANKRPTYIAPQEGEAAALRIPLAPAIAVGSISAPLLFG